MKSGKRTLKIITGSLALFLPALVLFGIWYPELSHHYVPNVAVDASTVEASRHNPADSVLEELSQIEYLPLDRNLDIVGEAEKIIRGRITIPWQGEVDLSVEFDPDDLDKGLPVQRLMMAALVPVAILLEAYEITSDERFFDAASLKMVGFVDYDREALIPKGFLRNDHATATRIGVATRFWKVYRHHPSYDPATAQKIAEMAARAGQYLSKPSHFRYQSNHGVMQNIALLQLRLTFPDIPRTEQYKRLAVGRLHDQMGFYLNDEGVILEHSAGYQAEGMKLMATIFRCLELLGEPIPVEWCQKYKKGMLFLARLYRPDGSLPLIGDTNPGVEEYPHLDSKMFANVHCGLPKEPSADRPPDPFGLYPTAGYAIWWGGLDRWPDASAMTQTSVSWLYFPGLGHKQSDEMSIRLWACGQDWWTGTGYWPYDTPGETLSRSWSGSNAPHLLSEDIPDPIDGNFFSARQTDLLAYCTLPDLVFIDLERHGPGALTIQRQIVCVENKRWVVLDYATASDEERMATVWTADHTLEVTDGPLAGTYTLSAPDGMHMRADFAGSAKPDMERIEASEEPFIGWQAVSGVAVPTTVIRVEQPADSNWLLASFYLIAPEDKLDESAGQLTMEHWGGVNSWRISIDQSDTPVYMTREADKMTVTLGSSGELTELVLTPAQSVSEGRQTVRDAFDHAGKRYPFYYSVIRSRVKISLLLLAVVVFGELFFNVCRRFMSRFCGWLRIVYFSAWVVGGIWLLTMYRF